MAMTTAVPERPSHGPITPVMPSARLALPTEEVNASAGPLDWKALVMAGLLALGFSSTFLGPALRIQTDQRIGGQILGESDSQPLTIPVTVERNDQVATVVTKPSTGTMTDALARAAAKLGGTLRYDSRGSSIYLTEYLSTENTAEAAWVVRHNDVVVTDLSSVTLRQGDTVTISAGQL